MSATSYYWCLHCERCYSDLDLLDVAMVGDCPVECPFDDCDGSFMDQFMWDPVFGDPPGALPRCPETGQRYSIWR